MLNREDFMFGYVHSVFTRISLYQSSPFRVAVSEIALSEIALSEITLPEFALSEIALSELALSEISLSEIALTEIALSVNALWEFAPSEYCSIHFNRTLASVACQGLYCCATVFCHFAGVNST